MQSRDNRATVALVTMAVWNLLLAAFIVTFAVAMKVPTQPVSECTHMYICLPPLSSRVAFLVVLGVPTLLVSVLCAAVFYATMGRRTADGITAGTVCALAGIAVAACLGLTIAG